MKTKGKKKIRPLRICITVFSHPSKAAYILLSDLIEILELDELVVNAKNLIKSEYTYEAAVERYRRILSRVIAGGSI